MERHASSNLIMIARRWLGPVYGPNHVQLPMPHCSGSSQVSLPVVRIFHLTWPDLDAPCSSRVVAALGRFSCRSGRSTERSQKPKAGESLMILKGEPRGWSCTPFKSESHTGVGKPKELGWSWLCSLSSRAERAAGAAHLAARDLRQKTRRSRGFHALKRKGVRCVMVRLTSVRMPRACRDRQVWTRRC